MAASSSSLSMVVSISLISSRDVSIKVKEVKVSSVLDLSLHCSSSSTVLEIVWFMVSFTLRSPRREPCVLQVRKSLKHALIISSDLSRLYYTPSSPWFFRRVHWIYLVPLYDIFVREL